MIATMMLAAIQASAPVPATPPAPRPGDRTVVRQIVIHQHPGAKPATNATDRQERSEIIIVRDGDDKAAAGGPDRRVRIVDVEGKPGERREVRVVRAPGDAGQRTATFSCDDGARLNSEAVEKDGKKIIVMICAKGNGNQIEALERATRRFAENNDLPADVRDRLIGQMNAEIARMKAAQK